MLLLESLEKILKYPKLINILYLFLAKGFVLSCIHASCFNYLDACEVGDNFLFIYLFIYFKFEAISRGTF